MAKVIEQIVRIVTDGDETRAEVIGELVRCKDCVNWYYFTKRCDEHNFRRDPDWFCADGERKETEDGHR